MPPAPAAGKKPAQPSKSRDLVPVGPREVVASKRHNWASKRDEYGNKPTTVKALILRNGKHGSFGTGELVSSKIRMAGREKLDLLAEDMMERYATAIAAPFDSLKCERFARSYFMAWLDEIENLQDPDLFYGRIVAETLARFPIMPSKNKKDRPEDPLNDPAKVATAVSARIHNAYLLASGWRLVGSFLMELRDVIKDDKQVKLMLQQNDALRKQYLVVYDLINIIVNINQQRFAQLATTAPHWKQYFKQNIYKQAGDEQPEFVFDWAQLKTVHKSFLDSIVVELCFPSSPFPKQILIGLLGEAIDETPRDSKQFPQALWDAMGDLSDSVEVLDLLNTPLLGAEGEKWKQEPREKPEEYLEWEDAQIFSIEAGKQIHTFKDLLVPLKETQKKERLDTIWKYINLNYQGVCGKTLDQLWNLDDRKDRFATWHAFYSPRDAGAAEGTNDADGPPALVPFSGKGNGKAGAKKPLAITDGNLSDDSMPSLQTVSDSSDEEVDFDSDDEEDSDDESDEGSDYDEELEEEFRDWYREAMDIAQADPDFHDPRREARDFEEMAAFKKDNPFIKLLGSLRGRLFSGSAAMKSTERNQPRQPYTGPKPPASAYKPIPAAKKPAPKPAKPTTTKAQPKSKAATVEDVSDEDEVATPAKKKKKKPKKKKKKAAAPTEEPILEEIVPEPESEPEPEPTPAPAQAPQKKAPPPKTKAPSVKTTASSTIGPFGSTTSLALPTEQSAQSARTYLKTEGLDAEKTKVKKRADHATLFGGEKPEKKAGIFSRFVRDKKSEVNEEGKYSFLSHLSKKAKSAMHQLLNTAEDDRRGLAPMKWDQFVKVMTEMGFSVDSSTAGSSVRFDPPDPKDNPITFHRPHPDSTIPPNMLRDFGKRLKRNYGWNDDDFLKKIS